MILRNDIQLFANLKILKIIKRLMEIDTKKLPHTKLFLLVAEM